MVGQGHGAVVADLHLILDGGGAVVPGVFQLLRRHGGGLRGGQGLHGLVHGDALLRQSGDEDLVGGQLVVGGHAAGADHRRGHVILRQDHQAGVVVQGVAALHQGLDVALAEGIPLHVVPAQAVGQGVRLSAVGPQAPAVLRIGHGVQRGLAQQLRAGQGAAEGRQIGGGGVDAAGADGVQGILGQGPGIGAPVDGGQIVGVKVPAGGEGAVQVQRGQDVLVHIVHEVHGR